MADVVKIVHALLRALGEDRVEAIIAEALRRREATHLCTTFEPLRSHAASEPLRTPLVQ
jgi:hypothetical protein